MTNREFRKFAFKVIFTRGVKNVKEPATSSLGFASTEKPRKLKSKLINDNFLVVFIEKPSSRDTDYQDNSLVELGKNFESVYQKLL